jgi:hypothetical protein
LRVILPIRLWLRGKIHHYDTAFFQLEIRNGVGTRRHPQDSARAPFISGGLPEILPWRKVTAIP